jgi:serine/threonine protein phosphatase 1
MSERHILIGDVHGMRDELERLLVAIDPRSTDTIVFLGDLLDKGPDSAGVVRLARQLREQGFDVQLVKGNHEDRHERYRAAVRRGDDQVKMKGMVELVQITESLNDDDIRFLETAKIIVQVPGGIAVHGGVLPTMTSITVEDLGKRANLLMRVRHVRAESTRRVTVEFTVRGDEPMSIPDLSVHAHDAIIIKDRLTPAGSFITLGKEGPDDPFWADVYDGRFGTIYFGHTPYIDADRPVEFSHAVGVDLGAVFGNRLAAVVLQDGQRHDISVAASGSFCDVYWED